MATSPTTPEGHAPIEINVGREIRAVAFAGNGECLVSGDKDAVRVWRMRDGKQMATMEARNVLCLAVSKDGAWIAAGTLWDKLFVWNARTYEKVLDHKEENNIHAVDFSPDSTRLVVASRNRTASIWDVATRQRVAGPLPQRDGKGVTVAKYSPQGDRIATATQKSVRVWDSRDGRLLVDVALTVAPWYNSGLFWLGNHLFIVSDDKIKEIDAITGLAVSEWAAPETTRFSCIALPEHGEIIAYSTNRTVTFWDMSTHAQFGIIHYDQDIHSIAFSPDDRFIALGGVDGKITIMNLSQITIAVPLCRPHPTFDDTYLRIDSTILDMWKHNKLADAEALLSAEIPMSQNAKHYLRANLALVRARLQQWDLAIVDAEKSIKIQPSVIAYIAKSIALVGKGERYKAYRAYDVTFEHFHSTHVSFLLLIKAIIAFLAGECDDAISRVDDLITRLRFNSMCYLVQAYMYFLLGSSRMESSDLEGAIQSFECARARLRPYTGPRLDVITLMTGWKFADLDAKIQQRLCEALYVAGREKEAGELLLKMVDTLGEELYTSEETTEWVSNFTQKCLSVTEVDGNVASTITQHVKVPIEDAAVLSPLLRLWVKSTSTRRSWKDALVTVNFIIPRPIVYQAMCEQLLAIDRITEASECFRQLMSEMEEQTKSKDDLVQWILDFKHRCGGKLVVLGDTAMGAERHDDAISHYSAALSQDPPSPEGLHIKRSKAYLAEGLLDKALGDANKAIQLDPASPWGYERKHAALHKAGDFDNAIEAFETALSKMSQSPDFEVRKLRREYVTPAQTKASIVRAVRDATQDSPRVLINTASGRLCNKLEQISAFESLPLYKELISSMTTSIDYDRIKREATEYYRYATFSHRWEESEPLFEKVVHIVVYDLKESVTHDKLQMFCKIVRDAGYRWAWSDTCCINKGDHFVLQEALVAMFKWYEGSAVTIVFLRGVRAQSQRRGDLMRSMWNTRAWTLQEYHASKAVQFYTEDWTPYLGLNIPNHKDSPEIMSEMEEATGISARALMSLRPGLGDIREKLCLASGRETTFVEDAAYSLLGIFSVSLPVVYGEGDKALGRLLSQLLTSSGDTSILAWTGKSGSFNSCLPANTTVFNHFPSSYIPSAIQGADMDFITTKLQTSPLNPTLVMKLYNQVSALSVPFFAGQRMKLPCLTFVLGPVAGVRNGAEYVFRAKAAALGVVEIKTTEDLSRLDSLMVVHPWIDFLLDRQHVGSAAEMVPEEELPARTDPPSPLGPGRLAKRNRGGFVSRFGQPFGARLWLGETPSSESLLSPAPPPLAEKRTQALRLIARLRQPFGALLFTPIRQNVAEYRRVAAGSLIRVRIQEDTPLEELIDNTRVLDVL